MKQFGTMHRLTLSASFLVAVCFSSLEETRAQTADAYNKEAMTQALATKQHYDHYGILFDFEKATIQREADALLDDIAATLRNFPQWGLRIIGHTDVSGTPAGNEKLSLERAIAIKQGLVNRGIAAARLETVGMGQTRPVASNDTREGRVLNRRVELVRLGGIEAEAQRILKSMSDYLASQKFIAFGYDANFEVVTKEGQKLLLASSGTIDLSRPDKVRVTRTGGFASIEMLFDGKTLTLLGKNANAYTQADNPGTIDNLVDDLREKLDRPIPGADLLSSKVYDQLMSEVIEGKDLGSGVIGGIECDHLAFRTKDIDWQIWIAHGARPYPCRYVITSKNVNQGPQYSIQIRDWRSGTEVAATNFGFANTTNARKVETNDLAEGNELPKHFVLGGAK